MAFEDSMKEGDGEELHQLYKLALLVYKAKNHHKYAYVTLLYLVKICAILSKFEAQCLKWNRFYNNQGMKGTNIPLDLEKEQQNHLLKTMWHVLGANVNEDNAARLASTIDFVGEVLCSVAADCHLLKRCSHRSIAKEEEAVYQIMNDLLAIKAFDHHINGGEGHPSFPKFKSNILECLDYRDLHKWIKEKLKEWASIYQPNPPP